MYITPAYALQAKFIAGLQICGEDAEGQLEWIGDTKQWQRAEDIETELSFEPYKSYESYK